MTDLPTGTVTFLFTDLEGSTRLWEQHPDAMRDALARHDEILREAVEKRDGSVVKTTGDGCHAAFAVPAEAIHAAIDAQRALGAEPWPLPQPIRVRMGLHSGAAEVRAGDYYGPAVNRAARISSVAHGGQIVSSYTTAELARDALDAGITLVDLGEHRLRDLGRAERLVQLHSPELTHTFPPLRSLETVPNNLPRQLSSFVGRERDVARARAALADAAIVTLTGVGGVGKTRLALQVAAEVMPEYPDGAWLVELAPLHDPGAIVTVVASALDLQLPVGTTPGDALVEVLARRRMLVVFDNCEHLIAAVAELVTDIARRCDGVRILATSREALGVEGERMLPVIGLSRSGDAATDPAVTLFVDRATAVRPDFELGETNQAVVAQICERLDGMPLAIELAAARVKALTPAAIAERLDQRFQLLAGGRRGAIERHQTLRAAIDWSYDLLDDVERAILCQLAVFAGSADLGAVEAVVRLDGSHAGAHLDAVEALVDKSLVQADDQDGAMRYRLLETIRQYALERLDEAGETAGARDRHLAHYVSFVERLSGEFLSARGAVAFAALEPEADNVRAAVMWAVDTGQLDAALRLLVAVSTTGWDDVNPVDTWYEVVAEFGELAEHPLLARVVATASIVTMRSGDADLAMTRARHSLDIAERHGTVDWLVHNTVANAALFTGRFDEALLGVDRALAIAPDDTAVALLRVQEAAIRSYAFGYAAGRDAASQARAAAERTGSAAGIGQAVVMLGFAERDEDPDRARALFEEALGLLTGLGASFSAQMAHSNLADFCARGGDLVGCRAHAYAAVDIAVRRADWNSLGHTLVFLAIALVGLGEPVAGAEAMGAAKAIAPNVQLSPQYESLRVMIDAALPADELEAAAARGGARTRDETLEWIAGAIDAATGGALDA